MFNVIKAHDNWVEIEMRGKLNSDEMRRALDDLELKSKGIRNGRLLYDIIDFHLPSFAAIAIELSRLPSMLGLVRKFDRAAVLADTVWLKKVSEFEGALIPGLEVKAFSRDQRAEAEAWLREGGTTTKADLPDSV